MQQPTPPSPQDRADLKIEWVAPSEIRKNPKNPRTHNRKQIRKLRASMRRFGCVNPIIVDPNGVIIAGHARYEAAISEGFTQLPIVRCGHLTPTAAQAYLLADNKIAEEAGWDRDLLALELAELGELMPAEGLEISLTGFDPPEINVLLADRGPRRVGRDDIVAAPAVKAVTRAGDIWLLTKQPPARADFRDVATLNALMGGAVTAAMITEPGCIDIAIKRWQRATKRDAILSGDGRTFDEIRAERRAQGRADGDDDGAPSASEFGR